MAKISKELHDSIKSEIMKELELAQGTGASPDFTEYGVTGLTEYGGYIREEFLPQLQWPHAAKIYQEMESNDPVVGAVLFVCEQLVRRIKWKVQKGGSSPVDEEAANFLESCLHDMTGTWSDTIAEILTMLPFGFALHEEVYKIRGGDTRDPRTRSKYNDGKIGWRRLPGRAQATIHEWLIEEDGSILGAIQRTDTEAHIRTLPMEKCLLFRAKNRYNNPEGRSLLRNAYRPWYFKKHIEEIEGIGIERDLAGLPVLKTPEGANIWNPDDEVARRIKNRAEQLVRNIRRDQNEGVVIPHEWELTLLGTGSQRQFDTNEIVNRYDQRIAITLLADIVMLGSENVGSFALANVKRSILGESLDAITKGIADVFNMHAIPRLFKLNIFPGITDYPKLVPGEVVAPELSSLARYIQALSGVKMPLFPDVNLEEYLREVVGMPSIENMSEEERQRQLQMLEEERDRGGGAHPAIRPTDQRQQNVGVPRELR